MAAFAFLAFAPVSFSAQGPLPVATSFAGQNTSLAISGASAVVKSGPGVALSVNVISASGVGAIYDAATISAASSVNEIAVIPATAGRYEYNFSFKNGLVISPSSGTMSVNYQ